MEIDMTNIFPHSPIMSAKVMRIARIIDASIPKTGDSRDHAWRDACCAIAPRGVSAEDIYAAWCIIRGY
jgi:hypothetical protein